MKSATINGFTFAVDTTEEEAAAVDASNRKVEEAELAHFATCPDVICAYVSAKSIHTWLGTPIGTYARGREWHDNFGGKRFHVTASIHGQKYHGQACYGVGGFIRLRKCK